MKKKLGVIGGMGPEATAYFYEEVIRHTKADCDQEHLDMTILSHASMPDRTKAIQSGECDPLLQAMEGDLKVMEAAGAEHIAIPCNTSHYFYDQIQAMTEIPIIHMPRETVRYAKEHFENVRRIGIMGTDGTVSAGIYRRECESHGIEEIIPSEQRQRDVMSLIYDDVKAGKKGNYHKFERVMEEFIKKDCDK